MLKFVPAMGWGGVIFGLATTILAWPTLSYLEVAFITMIPGFLLSTLYVMYTTKYEIETPRFHPGYFGLLFSSAPVLFFLFYILSS